MLFKGGTMPPKPKYTKEQIANTALNIVKEQGVASLSAREVAKRLGCTVSPIFTMFENMEDLKWAAREIALKKFEDYISDFKEYNPSFKRIGMRMISLAIHEPEVFKLLFMQERPKGHHFNDTIDELGEMTNTCISLIEKDYELTNAQAKMLFEAMWVYAYGIGSLCAMKVCDFTEEEIANRLGQIFTGQMLLIKEGKTDLIIGLPEKKEGKL